MQSAVKKKSFFGTVDVYEIDIESIPSPNWLRTNILAYDFTSMQQVYDASTKQKKIWFADTSVVHCMVCFRDASLAPTDKLSESDVLLLPVCNYQMMDHGAKLNSGQHWSLLRVFLKWSRDDKKRVLESVRFRHLDSAGRMNNHLSQGLIELLKNFYLSFGSKTQFLEENQPGFPQQENNHDCGAFVCCAARAYANAPDDDDLVDPDFASAGVSISDVSRWRETLLNELSGE